MDQKLHPCAYFSRWLTPAEQHYDVGNWELHAVLLALQEWRHWLEGSTQPIVVWTDHEKLVCLAYEAATSTLKSSGAKSSPILLVLWPQLLGR